MIRIKLHVPLDTIDFSERKLLAKKIALIVNGQDLKNVPSEKYGSRDGSDWHLDRSNDWWLYFIGEDEMMLSYRYWHRDGVETALNGLAEFLRWQIRFWGYGDIKSIDE